MRAAILGGAAGLLLAGFGLSARAAEAASPPAAAAAAPADRLRELRRTLDEKRKALERIEQERAALEGRVGEGADRLESLEGRRKDLERGGREAAEERRRLQAEADAAEEAHERAEATALSGAGLLYARTRSDSAPLSREELWAREALRRAVKARSARSSELEARRTGLASEAEEALRRAGDFHAAARRESEEERSLRRELEKRRARLKKAARELARARSELGELEAAAGELDRLMEKLKASEAPPVRAAAAGRLAPNSLPWPASGELVAPFGRQRLERAGAWIVSHGIRLATAPSAEVRAVRSGKVAFAGDFRGYGRVAIVDHGKGFLTVYGHLGALLKKDGDAVEAGEPVGRAGRGLDAVSQLASVPAGRGSVYFELRRDNRAVDPLRWLKRR